MSPATFLVVLACAAHLSEAYVTLPLRRSVHLRPQGRGTNLPVEHLKKYYYSVPATIGGQTFNLHLDTGSSDTWVTSALCSSEACKKHSRYHRTNNYKKPEDTNPFLISYADDTAVTLKFAVDVFSLGPGIDLQDQFFSEAFYDTDPYPGIDIDGILGIGPQEGEYYTDYGFQPYTVFTSLLNSGLVEENVFSLYLANDNSSRLTLGKSSDDQQRKMIFAKMTANEDFYQIHLNSIDVGGISLCRGGCSAVFDSGTAVITIPEKDHQALKLFTREEGFKWRGNTVLVPCSQSTFPTIEIDIGCSQTINIKAEDLLEVIEMKLFSDGTVQATCGITIYPTAQDQNEPPQWVLGDPFLRAYYTEYNMENRTIGFARNDS